MNRVLSGKFGGISSGPSHRVGRRASSLRVSAQGSSTDPPMPRVPHASSSVVPSAKFQFVENVFAKATAQAKAAGGAGGDTSFEGLLRVDSSWAQLKAMKTGAEAGPAPEFVNVLNKSSSYETVTHDVVVCGGTLGLFLALALQKKGLSVGVVERGPLVGRDQEWNISRKELEVLIEYGVLTRDQLESCIQSEFNPNRCGFYGAAESDYLIVENILNIGVSPRKLIEVVKANFTAAGGKVYENTPMDCVDVYTDAVGIVHRKRDSGNEVFGPGERQVLTAKLLLDCTGHNSPIVRQLRWGVKPDGVCLVVGGLATGPWPDNKTSDVIVTNSDASLEKSLQYFWEAFPAGSGKDDRTTYMFSYLDADPRRASLIEVFADYFELMPIYQKVKLEDLQFKRLLYGFFPTYRESPLKPGFDRVLQIGDASGIQSPLSFGGFGALLRHMPRLVPSVVEAIQSDSLDRDSLVLVNPYLPNLSASWLLQYSMSYRVGQKKPTDFINKTMASNFKNMKALGPSVTLPFLSDVIQFGSLGSILLRQIVTEPQRVPVILSQLDLPIFLDWLKHFSTTGSYEVLYKAVAPTVRAFTDKLPADSKQRFRLNRMMEAWKYGSGQDFSEHH